MLVFEYIVHVIKVLILIKLQLLIDETIYNFGVLFLYIIHDCPVIKETYDQVIITNYNTEKELHFHSDV